MSTVRLSTCVSEVPTGWFQVKNFIRDVFEKSAVTNLNLIKIGQQFQALHAKTAGRFICRRRQTVIKAVSIEPVSGC